ncbi:uncharacterized protein LOC125877450 [Solanum stenotomum]|uniref:uncharacterized protein LOC125877450 n=1 Tax=Solanum stenotomum TaxID=172797 RepID=UPI0020D0C057|nr:uncharacterized protein LOC125877450 [Solanum stenotomum]
MRFGKKGKLSPRYIGPYKIIRRVGKVAYELELTQELSSVHPLFHVSMLRKCIGDLSHTTPTEDVQVTVDLTYEEVPIVILDRQVRKLRNKEVASVKVLWRNQQVEEVTWEAEEAMKLKYPHLFQIHEKDENAKSRCSQISIQEGRLNYDSGIGQKIGYVGRFDSIFLGMKSDTCD